MGADQEKEQFLEVPNFLQWFSWPDWFPSHLNPALPGVILEGGELGYALSTAFGAVLDNPDLIVACIIDDGEAETKYERKIIEHGRFIRTYGIDPPEITDWRWR